MKKIISVSLGPSRDDYHLETQFAGHPYRIQRFGTDGSIEKASELILRWSNQADVIGLGGIKFPSSAVSTAGLSREIRKLQELGTRTGTPVTTGDDFRKVAHEWSLRHIQFMFGGSYFTNARVLFLSGMANTVIARVMSEYTDNLVFADPLIDNGIPKFLNSIDDLEIYAKGVHGILEWVPGKRLISSTLPLRHVNDYLIRQAIRDAHIIVVPYYDFFRYLENSAVDELGGKTVITATAYDDRVNFLKERGVDVIIDTTPKILEKVVGVSVLEAMIISALNIPRNRVRADDLLEFISEQRMDPRVIYPSGVQRRVNRFAYIVQPLSKDYFKKIDPINTVSRYAPPVFLDAVEKVMAYSPPFVYSKISGIQSPTGVAAEGWLIALGLTPEEMHSRSHEFIQSRLLKAARLAKRLGAQVIGIGTLTQSMDKAGQTLAKQADLPVTTGNSYVASGALWAAAEAVRRMGLLPAENGKRIRGKTMVIGATGAIGSVCCRLLAKAFDHVTMVGRNMAKLLALQESILDDTPDVELHLSTRADKYLSDMDVIVSASSGAARSLDISKVKPGCVITEVTRPLVLTREDTLKRPDVLVIRSGEIKLPGENVEMKDIGLPPKMAYAGLAETVALALEGRFEPFTVGHETEWDKVREIYRIGLTHGMELGAISGADGVYSDEDIARIKQRVLRARARSARSGGRPPKAEA